MGYMKEIWTSAEAVEPGNAFEARDAAGSCAGSGARFITRTFP